MRFCLVSNESDSRTGLIAAVVDIMTSLGDLVEISTELDDIARDDRVVRVLVDARFDCTIFWHTERIAERLLPIDIGRTLIVPRSGFEGNRADLFWLKFVHAQIFPKSRAHHERLQRLNCHTSYFQFFPDLPPPHRRQRETVRSGVFRELALHVGTNLETVLAHCRALGVTRLHVHTVRDCGSTSPQQTTSTAVDIEVTVSDCRMIGEYQEALLGASIIFAPFMKTGIDIASLEAMARGQIIVAPDRPGFNDYIAHLTSGLLYNADNPSGHSTLRNLDDAALERISRGALIKAAEGRRTWLTDLDRLKSIIVDDGRRWPRSDVSAAFSRNVRRSAWQRASDVS